MDKVPPLSPNKYPLSPYAPSTTSPLSPYALSTMLLRVHYEMSAIALRICYEVSATENGSSTTSVRDLKRGVFGA
eukprot:381326-Rhodomonas_salina.1